MKKKVIPILMALMIAGVSTAANGDGIVKVSVGGEQVGVELGASSVSSVQEIVDRLGAFSNYDRDSGKLEVEKPAVNVLVLEGVQKRSRDVILSNPVKNWTDKDVPRSFGVFVEIDNAPVSKELVLKVVLVGPNGKVITSGDQRTFSTRSETSFYFSEPFISTKLDQYGTYKVQVLMKRDKNSAFVKVGENTFTVGR
ncbi:hypothetical protein [Brevibacillus massiliensis]|jgi:hypothetical protein|uniref:hypothetical protein n=1 Tax=Brevibacillus massiliensis TaxID=1118054 RepID=UPI00031BEC80|nr:hypothetical protein [Brevibacillus massiliensis]